MILYNTEVPNKKRIEEYKKEEPLILDLVKIDPELQPSVGYGAGKNLNKKKFIGKNLLLKSGPIIYDPQKIVKTLINLI